MDKAQCLTFCTSNSRESAKYKGLAMLLLISRELTAFGSLSSVRSVVARSN